MAWLFEPHPAVAWLIVAGAVAGAYGLGLGRLLASAPTFSEPGVAPSERDEEWGTSEPPLPPKGRYAYAGPAPTSAGTAADGAIPAPTLPPPLAPAPATPLPPAPPTPPASVDAADGVPSLAELFGRRRERPAGQEE